MRRFTEHLAESADAHPYESERDRIVKAAYTAAKAAGLSNTQANKRAKEAVEAWKRTEGRILHSQFERERSLSAARSQARSEVEERAARAEIARLVSAAQSALRSAGFRSERRAQGGSESRYYSKGDIRVRLSDHEVPLTAEREHNRSLRGGRSPWVEFVFAERDRAGYMRANHRELDRLREWIRAPSLGR